MSTRYIIMSAHYVIMSAHYVIMTAHYAIMSACYINMSAYYVIMSSASKSQHTVITIWRLTFISCRWCDTIWHLTFISCRWCDTIWRLHLYRVGGVTLFDFLHLQLCRWCDTIWRLAFTIVSVVVRNISKILERGKYNIDVLMVNIEFMWRGSETGGKTSF
jgi:formate dehydrogenase maturation protein FdhE